MAPCLTSEAPTARIFPLKHRVRHPGHVRGQFLLDFKFGPNVRGRKLQCVLPDDRVTNLSGTTLASGLRSSACDV